MIRKIKYVGIGEYPTVKQMKLYRSAVSNYNEKENLYIYFNTSKGIKKRKLFDNPKQ